MWTMNNWDIVCYCNNRFVLKIAYCNNLFWERFGYCNNFLYICTQIRPNIRGLWRYCSKSIKCWFHRLGWISSARLLMPSHGKNLLSPYEVREELARQHSCGNISAGIMEHQRVRHCIASWTACISPATHCLISVRNSIIWVANIYFWMRCTNIRTGAGKSRR